MLRRVIEDTAEVAALGLFLAMIWLWAGVAVPIGV